MDTYQIDKTKLEAERSKLGLSIQALAERVDTSPSQIYKCCGHRGCKQPKIGEIAAVFNKHWWELLVKEDLDRVQATQNNQSPLILFHRRNPLRKKYYEQSFCSKGKVLAVSMMSSSFVKDVENRLTGDTHLTVLTWNPETEQEIRAFAAHMSEPGDHVKQTETSLVKWDELKNKFKKNLEVRTYASTPTLLGIVVATKWASVELMPFGTPVGMRPGLLLRNDVEEEQAAFEFFSETFDALRRSSVRRKAGDPPPWKRKKG
jgi:hypothetical protein